MHTSTTTTFLAITLCWMFSSGDTQGNAIGPELNKGHASIVARGDVGWIGPGQSFNIIVAVTPDPDWHVYWKNPGVSGAPTEIEIDAPEGYKVGEPIYPRPSIIQTGDGPTYGYKELAAIFVPVTAPPVIKDEFATFEVTTSWLACKKVCVLGKAETTITLSTNQQTQGPLHRDLRLVRWQKLLPRPLTDLENGSCHIDGNDLKISGLSGDQIVTFIGVERLGVRFDTKPIVAKGDPFSVHVPLILDFSAIDGESLEVEGLLLIGRNGDDPSYVVRIIANSTP